MTGAQIKLKRAITLLLCISITIGALVIALGQEQIALTAKADSSKILTLGADLSAEQKQLILDYLGVSETQVEVVTVYNADEHALLDNIATQQQIGKKTYSCSFIEPTESGGIHIKTVNLNWVTCEMIRNALVTSGINNCNIICVSPIEVSGTGALTGIFKAYETIQGSVIPEEKKILASEELITTCDIAGTVGQEKASTLVSELKEQIIVSETIDREKIESIVSEYIQGKKFSLTEEQKWALVELLLKISEQDYDIEEVKEAYADLKTTVANVQAASNKTMNFLQRFLAWLKELWQKITGTYNQIKQSQQYTAMKQQLGIIMNTDDSVFWDKAVTTITEDIETPEGSAEENASESKSESGEGTSVENGNKGTANNGESAETTSSNIDGHWYSGLLKIFNSGNSKQNTSESPSNTEETEQDQPTSETNTESNLPSLSDLQTSPSLNTGNSKSLDELIK